MQLEMECTGYGEQRHAFDKPFFQSIAMFLAMSLALPIQTVFDAKKKKDAQYKPLSDSIQDTVCYNETILSWCCVVDAIYFDSTEESEFDFLITFFFFFIMFITSG